MARLLCIAVALPRRAHGEQMRELSGDGLSWVCLKHGGEKPKSQTGWCTSGFPSKPTRDFPEHALQPELSTPVCPLFPFPPVSPALRSTLMVADVCLEGMGFKGSNGSAFRLGTGLVAGPQISPSKRP